ncbi:MAG: rubredoxin [Methanoregula sp.]|jgi:rubredoxin|uniref:rubredoxin n=1 Tax=Methanoregula sp. TaxID=2052170 RepID=UPI003D09DF44
MPRNKGGDCTDRYVCTICGHGYDPEKGDPLQDISPGPDFISLPDDWQCHVCFPGKKLFTREC